MTAIAVIVRRASMLQGVDFYKLHRLCQAKPFEFNLE